MVLTDDYHSWNLFILVKNKNRTMDYQAYPSYVKSAVYRPHFFIALNNVSDQTNPLASHENPYLP